MTPKIIIIPSGDGYIVEHHYDNALDTKQIKHIGAKYVTIAAATAEVTRILRQWERAETGRRIIGA